MADKDRVLALDIATKTGWALFTTEGELIGWGVVNCAPTKRVPRWERFRRALFEVVPFAMASRLDRVVMEAPFTRFPNTSRVLYGLAAHAEHWAEEMDIPHSSIAATSIKLTTTGDGHASKAKVCAAMHRRYPAAGLDKLPADQAWDASDAVGAGVADFIQRGILK